jgi:hypothetical protein
LQELRSHGQQLPVNQRQLFQLDSQLRDSTYASCLLRDRDTAGYELSPLGNYPAVGNQGLLQRAREPISYHILIAGEPFGDAHGDNCPCL